MRHCSSASRLLQSVPPLPAWPNAYIYAAEEPWHQSLIGGARVVLSMRTRTKIIFHGFTRLRFHESMVIRADDGASALHVDLSGVL
jgi:hypothetical protein